MTEVKSAITIEQINSCFETMHILRPHLKHESFVQTIVEMQKRGYHLIYIEENGKTVAASGYRYTEHLAWGKVIYIDDLVTHTEYRKKGFSHQLLDYICNEAGKKDCDAVHLDSGPSRFDAHKLYHRYGFNITSHHFALSIKK